MRSPSSYSRPALAALALAFLLAPSASATQETSQTFLLQPGWSSIYLEVEPADNDTAAVFGGLPVDSVWTWRPDPSPVQFVANPSEPQLRRTGWLGYFPASRPESFLTNLHRVQANRPYLIKLGGSSPVSFTVTGRPSWRPRRWVPDSFNLVGAEVDPAAPPTFESWFAGSPAHDGQAIYRLDGTGTWQPTSPTATMASGEAFWIYTKGSSDWAGPMQVVPRLGDGIDFDRVLREFEVNVTNRGTAPASYTARLLTAGPISYQTFDAGNSEFVWNRLDSSTILTAGPGEATTLRLAVRRNDLTGPEHRSILEITDGAGGRVLLPLHALPLEVTSFAGLWIGSVSLDQVSSLPAATVGSTGPPPLEPTTSSTFDLRLLVHVDDGGQARLLRDVIQMWEDGATAGDPGRFVLLTDPSRIGDFEGSSVADGEQVGRRVSTAGYDFGPDSADWDATALALSFGGGNFGTGGSTLATAITLPPTHPSNPFYHRYHPDHDQDCGCDALYTAGTTEHTSCVSSCDESFEIVRELELTFAAADPTVPDGADPRPDWLVTRVAGSYAETITGLHRLPLEVAGTFTLQRVADQGELNP